MAISRVAGRRIFVLLGVFVGLLLLVEVVLRVLVPGVIATKVREQLHLPAAYQVGVSLRGPQVFYALTGAVGGVKVDIADAPLSNGVVATMVLTADRLPFNPVALPLHNAQVKLFVAADDLDALVTLLTGGVADHGDTRGSELVVGRTVQALGMNVPIEARLKLQVWGDKLRVIPTGLRAVGFDFSAKRLDTATGGLLQPLLQPHDLCVAEQLPRGVSLRKIKVTQAGVRVEARLADDLLTNSRQWEHAGCV